MRAALFPLAAIFAVGLGCAAAQPSAQASLSPDPLRASTGAVDEDPQTLADLLLATTARLPGERARPIVLPVPFDGLTPNESFDPPGETQRALGRADATELRVRCTGVGQLHVEVPGDAPSIVWLDGSTREDHTVTSRGRVWWRSERLQRRGDAVVTDTAYGWMDASSCRYEESQDGPAQAGTTSGPIGWVTHRATRRARPLLPGGLAYGYRYTSGGPEEADLLIVLLPRVSEIAGTSSEGVVRADTGDFSRIAVRLGPGRDVSWLARVDFAVLQQWLRALGADESRRELPSSGGTWIGSVDVRMEVGQARADTSPVAMATIARAPWQPITRTPRGETVTRPGAFLP